MLHWILNDVAVDESVFTPGKQVYLEAAGLRSPPERFQVYQVYSSAMRRILQYVGVPERRSLVGFATKLVPVDRYRSDYLWALPAPRGSRKSSCFVFVADSGQQLSPRIYCSRIGAVELGLVGGATAKVPAGPIHIGVEGKGEVKTTMRFAVDPVLAAEVLTGEALAEHTIENLVADIGDDPESPDVAARIDVALPRLRDTLSADYRPPGIWATKLSEANISGSEGDVVEQALRFDAPAPGTGCYAVTYYDASSPEFGETTDAWLVTVDENGNVSVTIDTSAMRFRDMMLA